MKVRFTPPAARELQEARAWYADREPAIAEAFLDEIFQTVDRIAEHPEAHGLVLDRMRRAMLRRFPYFLVFEVLNDEAVVFGVIHGARDPRSWSKRPGR